LLLWRSEHEGLGIEAGNQYSVSADGQTSLPVLPINECMPSPMTVARDWPRSSPDEVLCGRRCFLKQDPGTEDRMTSFLITPEKGGFEDALEDY